jgi:hypothetical protein
LRIERGFIRPEDEPVEDAEDGEPDEPRGDGDDTGEPASGAAVNGRPPSDRRGLFRANDWFCSMVFRRDMVVTSWVKGSIRDYFLSGLTWRSAGPALPFIGSAPRSRGLELSFAARRYEAQLAVQRGALCGEPAVKRGGTHGKSGGATSSG